ncbi:hypothetical protein ACFL2K_05260, partial [Candidatus Margulisiibacteriota bacterium]
HAQLNALKSNLSTIRAAVSMQFSENILTGTTPTYPATISSSMFETAVVPSDPYADSSAVATSSTDPLKGAITVTTGGWVYNPTTGEVRCNHSDRDDY